MRLPGIDYVFRPGAFQYGLSQAQDQTHGPVGRQHTAPPGTLGALCGTGTLAGARGCHTPSFSSDWSPLSGDQEFQVLRASLPVKGRALTLYGEVHPRSKLGGREVQHAFLDTLKALPAGDGPSDYRRGFRVSCAVLPLRRTRTRLALARAYP